MKERAQWVLLADAEQAPAAPKTARARKCCAAACGLGRQLLIAVHAAQVSSDRAQHLGRFGAGQEAWPPAGIFNADAVPPGAPSCCA